MGADLWMGRVHRYGEDLSHDVSFERFPASESGKTVYSCLHSLAREEHVAKLLVHGRAERQEG